MGFKKAGLNLKHSPHMSIKTYFEDHVLNIVLFFFICVKTTQLLVDLQRYIHAV